MQNNPHLLTKDNVDGLEWAKTKKYAFLMESSSIEYLVERNCKVMQIGGLLDDKGYGIAMRKSANSISKLNDLNTLHRSNGNDYASKQSEPFGYPLLQDIFIHNADVSHFRYFSGVYE